MLPWIFSILSQETSAFIWNVIDRAMLNDITPAVTIENESDIEPEEEEDDGIGEK